MKFTAEQIAQILDGSVDGNPSVEVSKLSKIEEGELGSLTFLSNPKYEPFLYTTKATVTIINKDFKLEREVDTTLIRVENAYKAFSQLLAYYNQVKTNKKGRENPSFISDSANIGEGEYIGASLGIHYVFSFCLNGRLSLKINSHKGKTVILRCWFKC